MASKLTNRSGGVITTQAVRHLYVHVPFCPHVCPYCSFHVLPVEKLGFEKLLIHLLSEYRSLSASTPLETVFLGGGTPTALSTKLLLQLLSELDLKGVSEVTSECNPSTLNLEKAKMLLDLGVNRLSIGAQSFDPTVLKTLGRTHSVKAIHECVEVARVAGFKNINLDLIFGIPGQSSESWTKTLETALSLKPQHLSCYGLTYEEDTEFFRLRSSGKLKSNILEKEMFDLADEILVGYGFDHYEISNYSLPDFECVHNLAYWSGKNFYGIGPSAVSTVAGTRKRNGNFDLNGWKCVEEECLSQETLASERVALGLRTQKGVDLKLFETDFGYQLKDRWSKELDLLTKQGLLENSGRLSLSSRGRAVADEVAVYFV